MFLSAATLLLALFFGLLAPAGTNDNTDPKVTAAKGLHQDRSPEINEICQTLRPSRSTFYRCLAIT